MKKLGILLDSFSGATKPEINNLGFEFIAQIVEIDHKVYKDGENIFMKDVINTINTTKNVKTSMPPIGAIIEKFEEMSKKYKVVIFIAMHSGLSSTFSTSFVAAKAFKNVYVITTKLFSSAIIDVAKKVVAKFEKGQSITTILNYIKEISDNSFGYIIPKDLERIINSGRLKSFQKLVMKRVKLIPKLFMGEEGFEIKGISRNFSKSCKNVVEKINEKINLLEKKYEYNWGIATTGCNKTFHIAKNAIIANGINEKDIQILNACVGVLGHSGVGSIGIIAWPK